MKKIKLLLLSISLLMSFTAFTANLDIKFTNMKISGSNLVFDIEVQSNTANTYIGGLEFYINYNTAGFGTNIAPSITANPAGGILTGYSYTNLKSNNSSSRLKLTTYISSSSVRALMPTTYGKVYTVTMPIIDANNNAGINLQMSLMGSGQIYYMVVTGGSPAIYTPVNAINNLTTLPLNPNLALLISEIGDPSDLTTDSFIELYNAGATTVDFTNHYAWYLSINSSTSTKLAGTLAPGATYVMDITGTTGTSDFLLSTYGDYTTGTQIDIYDGSLTGFDFTGKQAVRHYNIVSPNLTPALSEWVIRTANDMDMTAGSHRTTLTWAGVNADWHSNANWTGSFIPDAGHNVAINAGITPVIGFGDNAYAHDLAVGAAGLTIQSLPGADGSLITYGTVSGNANVERFLSADRYWYVTQPVTSATANVFLHTWMFTYNAGAWSAFIEDESTPLNVMKGYAVWTSSSNKYDQDLPPLGDTTTAYNGILNTGNISTGLTAGWNFVGNPYPSAVDWEATGWDWTGITPDAFGVWNGSTYANYTALSGSTNGGSQYIPAGQGFFVEGIAGGNFGVSNAVRTHNPQAFWKSEESMTNRLSLVISGNDINDETVIYFNENASPLLDEQYDAGKMIAEAAPQAYTLLGEKKMSINTFHNTSETNKVTLGINAPEAGDYTITASNLESFDASVPVYLEDVLTGQKVNLREMSTYAFSSDEGMSDRFVVHFAEYQGVGDNPISEVNSIYAVDQTVYVDFTAIKGEISIYNILGQEISHTGASNGLNMITVPQGNAVYIVKVISDNTTVTKKVFVK